MLAVDAHGDVVAQLLEGDLGGHFFESSMRARLNVRFSSASRSPSTSSAGWMSTSSSSQPWISPTNVDLPQRHRRVADRAVGGKASVSPPTEISDSVSRTDPGPERVVVELHERRALSRHPISTTPRKPRTKFRRRPRPARGGEPSGGSTISSDVFKLLLTVFLGVCVGAVVADLLFGPDQPATQTSESQGQHWEPWRSWYLSARRQSRRILAAIVAWAVTTAQAVDRGARRLGRSAVAMVQLVPDSLRSMQTRRQAVAERNAAHARHVAHLEAVTPQHDLLPPPVAPPLHPSALPETHGAVDPSRMSVMSGTGGMGEIEGTPVGPAGANGNSAPPNGSGQVGPRGSNAARPIGRRGLGRPDTADPSEAWGRPDLPDTGPRRPRIGPPMAPPPPVGPPVPARLRGQGLVETSELPIDGGLVDLAGRGEGGALVDGSTTTGPLGRPPWGALVRRPTPGQAPTPGTDGRRRGLRRSRRDPLSWAPGDGERPPDPEWDEGVPAPIVVPMRVRARSAAMLLAMTTIFGVVTAAAVLIAVVMAVGALSRF